jgi:hypothetical protein
MSEAISRRLSRPVAGSEKILDEKISGSTAKAGRRALSEEGKGIVQTAKHNVSSPKASRPGGELDSRSTSDQVKATSFSNQTS